jgi:hypothetical protein
MKKTLTIGMLLFSIATYAQGNLQFNQVLTFSGTLQWGSSTATLYTVPIGKTCKIEAMGLSGYTNSTALNINNVMYVNYVQSGQAPAVVKETIWLKAGDQIKFTYSPSGYTIQTHPYFLSMIEYNIVQ